MKGITMVRDRKEARAVLNRLHKLRDVVHSVDEEDIGWNKDTDSPVGHGRIICFSLFAGPKLDFGNGPMIWVDTLDGVEPSEFADYFYDQRIKKTAHNWSHDYHEFGNHGVRVRGIASDTMHQARLLDAERMHYSLESLTEDYLGDRKKPMMELFGIPVVKKNGEAGKQKKLPALDALQRSDDRERWIRYSVGDTSKQWRLERVLRAELAKLPWMKGLTQLDLYDRHWAPLCNVLLQMEARGIYVNTKYLAEIQPRAEADAKAAELKFKRWAAKFCPEAVYMNLNSDEQLQVLLFGGSRNMLGKQEEAKSAIWKNKNPKEGSANVGRVKPGVLPRKWTFDVANVDGFIDPTSKYKKPKVKRPMTLVSLGIEPDKDEKTDGGWPAVGGRVLDRLAGEPDKQRCSKCKKAVKPDQKVCGAHPKAPVEAIIGAIGAYFDSPKAKLRAAYALDALADVGRINTLLSNFIIPLQSMTDARGRVHTALNLNTATGRLSSRKPNNQNQPAKEKDRYGIRDAFEAEPLTRKERRTILHKLKKRLKREPTLNEYRDELWLEERVLIVSDYANLELRIAAHLANCFSMLEAFKLGGDFHSRTAMGMYAYIKEAVERGEVLVDGTDDKGTPIVKDVYPIERGVAKIFNFSILYGKTVYGLAKDLHCTEEEAHEKIQLWFEDRPEIRGKMDRDIMRAYDTGYVRTLLGRLRPVPSLKSHSKGARNHGERVVKNTPVQGGAADIVNAAMVKCEADEELRTLGCKLLLQVHDELIHEVTRRHSERARERVMEIMSQPFKKKLRVDLVIDSHIDVTWKCAK